MTKKKKEPAKKATDKTTTKPKTTRKTKDGEVILTGKDKERYHNLLEELEAVCRHYAQADGEKKHAVGIFNDELAAISKRKEGILKDIDNLKRPLPLFDQPGPPVKFCEWAGCKDPQQAGSVYCKKHDKEHTKLRKKEADKKKQKPKEIRRCASSRCMNNAEKKSTLCKMHIDKLNKKKKATTKKKK